ncbi:MAG TPA: chemotaxis protein CheA [Pyrinomonadaceae bacterium]
MSDPNQPPDEIFSQFLDDYFAECEEHLAVVRRDLLNIERFVGHARIDTVQLDELFRSFHTIKGISGMVGLAPAEQLAHEMEGYLRVLRQGDVALSQIGYEALMDGTKLLAEVIEAHKNQAATPDITKSVTALNLATNSTTTADTDEEEAAVQAAADKKEWRFLFVPSQERSDAGINVNSIRARLQSLGEILKTTPLVENGEVAFEFLVATSSNTEALNELKDIGLTFTEIIPEITTEVTSTSISQAPATSVRVDLVRLDQLMLLVGELVVTRARLEQNLNSIRSAIPATSWRQLQEVNVTLGKQLRDLRNDVMRVRMVPIAEVFERMRFVVRDIAKESKKRVKLELSGQETEIDKFLVERLMDPLLHLVRNSISHGIESEMERLAAGKPATGRVSISATTAGELVIIEIGDDGKGIDVQAVETKSGVQLLNEDGSIHSQDLLDIICSPGFSTRQKADRASGRGVGMDVVARAIADLDGYLSVHTEKGVGTTFRIELPLTLAITDALIATIGGQTFAIHRSSVQEVIEIETASIKAFENNEIVLHRDEVLPLIRLSNVFNLPGKSDGRLQALVVGLGSRATGLVVDKILGLREVVVRPLNDPLTNVPGIAGATELGDGRPVLILDVMEILDETRGSAAQRMQVN